MEPLVLHQFHEHLGAAFTVVQGAEAVADYGDFSAEHLALGAAVGLADLSFRGRLCLTGAERTRFFHGQVTQDIQGLSVGEGAYAALVTAKGKLESDLNVYCLPDELLLDVEPGQTGGVARRLAQFIVADDVQVVEVASLYGLLSFQGPGAAAVARALAWFEILPAKPFAWGKGVAGQWGELYLMNQSRLGAPGFDLYAPVAALPAVAEQVLAAVRAHGGRLCGWRSWEARRIEAGLPRFGVDMDPTLFPQECGIEARAVSYRKGCYVGQEVLNRIHTVGRVNRQLAGLRLADDLAALPLPGDKLVREGEEVGRLGSVLASPAFGANIALACLRRECGEPGTHLSVRTFQGESAACVVPLPFTADAVAAAAPGPA